MVKVEDAIWMAEGAKKRSAVQSMFAEIAPTYDRINSLLSLSLHHRWRGAAVSMLRLESGDSALDVCCGTGDFMVPLRSAVGNRGKVLGLDFCLPMVRIAKQKLQETVSLGDACSLPVGSEKFDGVTVGWGIRNVADIDLAHREIARVLKAGGRFVSLDMALPQSPLLRSISRFIGERVIPRLGAMFGKSEAYTYLPKSTERFWDRDRLKQSMEQAGFIDVRHKDFMLGNICVHFGRKPGEYKA